MEIRYTGLAPADLRLDISEEDMARVHSIVGEFFVSMLPHLELERSYAYYPEKAAVADLAKKYGVHTDHPASLVNFYRAILGLPSPSTDNP